MNKFSNDTSLTRLGDHYHYLIALEECLDAKPIEVLFLEQKGDIAIGKRSIEVKHHINPSFSMGDKHPDLWKTLKNHVENYSVLEDYDELILLTTAKISKGCLFEDWNKYRLDQRMEILYQIKENITKTIEPFVNKIFDFSNGHTREKLESIASRFKIIDCQPTIERKIRRLLQHAFFKSYPGKNKRIFLDELVSFISNAGRDNPLDWRINISDFNYFVEMNARNYIKEELPIPDLYRDLTVDVDKFRDFKFVQELREIGLVDRIKDAANDFFRAQKTVDYLVANDPIVPDELTYYQNQVILMDLKFIKEEKQLELDQNNSQEEKLLQSKKCYFEAMKMPLKNVKGYDPNRDFFQRGTIHTIVNSRGKSFSWKF